MGLGDGAAGKKAASLGLDKLLLAKTEVGSETVWAKRGETELLFLPGGD